MKKAWIIFLILSGLLGISILIEPSIIVITIIFFPLFFLLFFMPTIFIYSTLLTFFFMLMRPLGKIRVVLAPVIVALLGFGIPYYLNMAAYDRVEALLKDDKEIQTPIGKGETIAFDILGGYNYLGMNANFCQSLCPKLLYNGAFKAVIVKPSTSSTAYKFFIEKREHCPVAKDVSEAVAMRIAVGECLIGEESSLEEADIVYNNKQIVNYTRNDRLDPRRVAIDAKRIQIIDKRGKEENILYQKTEVKFKPLKYPLMIGPSGGRELQFYTAFTRIEKNINLFEKTSQKEQKKIFGDAANTLEVNQKDKMMLIQQALESDSPQKQGGHLLIEK